MRVATGIAVFVVGLGALGLWARSDHAREIERTLTAASASAVEGLTRHEVTTRVSGRDITVSGLAHDEAERARILETLDGLSGRRVVIDDLRLLPAVAPYTLSATKAGDTWQVIGVAPDRAGIAAIVAALPGGETNATLDLAAGEPDRMWAKAAIAGLRGLAALSGGTLAIEDRTVTLTGEAPSAAALTATQEALGRLPDGYTLIADVVVPPEPTLTIERRADGIATVEGTLPGNLDADRVAAALGIESVTVTAMGGARHVPGWDRAVTAGLSALALLDHGTLRIANGRIRLSGAVRDAAAEAAVRQALVDPPAGFAAEATLTLPPRAALEIAYDAATGAVVRGQVPSDADLAAVRAALPVEGADIDVATGARPAGADLVAAARAFGALLGEFETATLTASADGVALQAETQPGARTALLRDRLAAALGDGATLSLAPTTRTFEDGTERVNQATGVRERYRAGYWLPVVAFEADLETCAAQSKAALDDQDITFLSGSADLDVTARAAINRLAAIVRVCTGSGALALEIGGHTDNTGGDDLNRRLSEARASTVADALIARGIDRGLISAKGYGASQPIADNATEEGRARNRRTEVTWIER